MGKELNFDYTVFITSHNSPDVCKSAESLINAGCPKDRIYLVVDDDETNLKMVGHILSRAHMRVTAMKSGEACSCYFPNRGREGRDGGEGTFAWCPGFHQEALCAGGSDASGTAYDRP